jgi:DNA-binding MarR family transcriptional regulator
MSIAFPIGTLHRRRLRDVWRSAGWPYQDGIEIELLAAGLIERVRDAAGRETLRVTDAGIALLAQTLATNRGARDAHEALVERVALQMQRAGRIVWRALSLRAKVNDAWALAMPDVFSIRHTSVEDYLEPVVHEIKVRRADLLSDLRHAHKGAAYCELSSQCWYVIKAGIAQPQEIPPVYGVMLAHEQTIEIARAAPARPHKMPFHLWMSLARAAPLPSDDDPQHGLADVGDAQSTPPKSDSPSCAPP